MPKGTPKNPGHCRCCGKTFTRTGSKQVLCSTDCRLDYYTDVLPGLGPWGDCFEWRLKTSTRGYGHMKIEKRMVETHIASYLRHRGPVPEGKILRHTCDNRLCNNVGHLITGTHADNSRDRVERNRQAKGSSIAISKLNNMQSRVIRRLADLQPTLGRSERMTHRDIGSTFNVSKETVGDIKSGKTWKHTA
jgi:hypothetical protein